MTTDPHELSVLDAARAIKAGELEPEAYSEAFEQRRTRLQPRLNAFITPEVRDDEAREGSLGGIPVAIKDNIETRGLPTTCASRILDGYRSSRDATVVQRLVESGAVITGKTNLDEFAMGSSNEHSAYGVCRNPWDLERVPGGSSGGSAAAVAAGMVPVALGSDTGGSVRQPAAFCGLVGIKPTYGRVSRSGLVAFASSLDQVGVLARRARDAAAVLEVIAGHDPLDATTLDAPVPAYSEAIESDPANLEGIRIGVVREAREGLSVEIEENLRQAVAVLEELGAVVEPVDLPTLPYAIATYYIIANAEASANLARFDGVRYGRRAAGTTDLDELYLRSRSEGFGEEVKRRILLGTYALSSGYYEAYYGKAQKARLKIRVEMDQALEKFEMLLTPTAPEPAFRIGEKSDDLLAMYLSDIMTAPASLSGHPAIAVPSGFTSAGLPLSIQLIGRRLGEPILFRAADAFEERTRHFEKRPSLDPA